LAYCYEVVNGSTQSVALSAFWAIKTYTRPAIRSTLAGRDPELPLSVAESRHKFHGESGHRCDRQIATQCETARSTKAAVAFGLKADISQIGRSRPLAAVTVS
jgi:hypothetical protein